MIELLHVSKKYGNKPAVNDLHLTIGAGEMFAFLGPNGAGKTTTIKMMCGLLFPTTGVIRIAGYDLETQGQDARQQISYVPDTPFLYEKLTGREVLRFVAEMYRMPRGHANVRIAEMIELFNLYTFIDDLTQNYSHGMRQRTVFASALLHEPQVLIVDEPTVGLDPRSIRLLKDVLRNETKRGATVFLSTHSLDIAQELSDRIGVINQGKLIGCGTLDELRRHADHNGTLEEVFLKMTDEEEAGLRAGDRRGTRLFVGRSLKIKHLPSSTVGRGAGGEGDEVPSTPCPLGNIRRPGLAPGALVGREGGELAAWRFSMTMTPMTPAPSLLFQNLRWVLFRNSMTILLTQSWVRVITIGYCCALIWGSLFALSWYGFHDLKVRWNFPLEGTLIETVLDIFFFLLTVLLIFSSGIILYSSLFVGAEAEFLLASPVPDDRIFAYKFQSAVAFSSWAFVLVGSPVLLAYGLEVSGGAPWYYYAVLPLFFLGFLLIPGSLGALACLLIVNLVPRYRKQIIIGFLLVLLFICLPLYAVWWYQESKELGFSPRTWFESLLNEMTYLGGRLSPFHWMSRGLRYAALGRPDQMGYNLGLVWSYGLFTYLATVWIARKLYRRGFNRLASGGALRKRYGGHWLDEASLPRPVLSRSADANAHRQGLPHLPPRSRSMGPGSHFPRHRQPLFRQHAPLLRAGHRPQLQELHQPADVDFDFVFDVRLHRPIHLSDAEPRRAQVLDSRPVASGSRPADDRQVRLLVARLFRRRRIADRVCQSDARHAVADRGRSYGDDRHSRAGDERVERRPGRRHAELPRD